MATSNAENCLHDRLCCTLKKAVIFNDRNYVIHVVDLSKLQTEILYFIKVD